MAFKAPKVQPAFNLKLAEQKALESRRMRLALLAKATGRSALITSNPLTRRPSAEQLSQ